MIQALISHNPDIQKLLAFEGLFEKLFSIISKGGGVDGGIVVQEALICVDGLLRYNSSNQVRGNPICTMFVAEITWQSYFRETQIPPQLRAILLFPVSLHPQQPAPQQFALQFWDDQKSKNSAVVIGIIGLLLAGTSDNVRRFNFTQAFQLNHLLHLLESGNVHVHALSRRGRFGL